MAFLVERPIQRPASGAAAVALDLGGGVQVIGDEPAQRLGVVSGVGDDMADTRQVSDQPLGLRAVGPMALRDREPDRQAERVHSRMDLGRQTAAGAADGVSFRPRFCEVASAWTLEMVASISTYSKSGSVLNSLKRRPHTPARDQRRNRVQTLFQCPSSGGRSRQGEAPRASHSTASMNSRLSAPLRP